MDCPTCSMRFESDPRVLDLGFDKDGYATLVASKCPDPECSQGIIQLYHGSSELELLGGFVEETYEHDVMVLYPRTHGRPPCPPEVPPDLSEDYTEACLVLADSPKASAALSRRCLQALLRDAAGVKPSTLVKEIDEVIAGGKLPSELAESLHMVRHVGNFAAHPIKSESTGEILPVEPVEAEYNLVVLEGLFDHYHVAPKRLAARKAALNQKLKEAGKPPLK